MSQYVALTFLSRLPHPVYPRFQPWIGFRRAAQKLLHIVHLRLRRRIISWNPGGTLLERLGIGVGILKGSIEIAAFQNVGIERVKQPVLQKKTGLRRTAVEH